MTVYLTRPPSPPRDSEKTAMSVQLLVVALTRASPLTLIVPEPPPAWIDNELSLTDNTQRPSPGLSTSRLDRKSTRLNSSHVSSSYAVFCLKKKMASQPS